MCSPTALTRCVSFNVSSNTNCTPEPNTGWASLDSSSTNGWAYLACAARWCRTTVSYSSFAACALRVSAARRRSAEIFSA